MWLEGVATLFVLTRFAGHSPAFAEKYWQIYKYELTGQREPKEKRYITIGNIIAGYMRWSVKIAFGMIRLIFSFI